MRRRHPEKAYQQMTTTTARDIAALAGDELPAALAASVAARPRGVRYTQVPDWVAERVSGTALKVLTAILRHVNRKTGWCFPKRKTLAEKIGRSLAAVDRAIRELKQAGVLLVWARWRDNGGQSSNGYMMPWRPLESTLTRQDAEALAALGIDVDPADFPPNEEGGLTENDEGGTSPTAADERETVSAGGAVASGNTRTPLIRNDEGVWGVNQIELEEGGTGPVERAPRVPASPDGPPPSTCPKHPQGTPDPCGACGWYRRRTIAWEAEQAQQRAEQAAAERQAAAEHAALQAAQQRAERAQGCEECDDHGYRPDGRECDHRRRTTEARLAATAATRAHFAGKPSTHARPRQWWRRRHTDLRPPTTAAPIPGLTT